MENYAILLKNTPEEEGLETKTSPANERVKLRMIGSIGIPRLNGDGKSAEVGYGILPSYWGKGYATEALSLFTAYYWNSDRTYCTFTLDEYKYKMGTTRNQINEKHVGPVQTETIQAVVEPENTASMRVLSKAGFKRGELNERAYEVDDLEGGGKRWVRAYPFYLERPAVSEALE